MAHFIPRVEATLAVGASNPATDRPFDDLVQVGEWPARLVIRRLHSLEVFSDTNKVVGFRATYKLDDGSTKRAPHGHTTGNPSLTIPLSDTTYLAGVFGGLDKSGVIVKIGFVIFNADPTRPPVEIKGPVGSSIPAHLSFGSYGNIIAFIGVDNNDTGLKSLGFVKKEGESFGILAE
ncbi:hypothetical protein BJV74DRAFT_874720 [Russula compacta]|nr:hypothetical protein BJV74DRAFT_874720 [Russula compacta]